MPPAPETRAPNPRLALQKASPAQVEPHQAYQRSVLLLIRVPAFCRSHVRSRACDWPRQHTVSVAGQRVLPSANSDQTKWRLT